MRALLAFGIIALFAGASDLGAASRQDYRARFEIVAPNDTAFTIVLADAQWVKPGMIGNVVDPRQRDDAVASFRVASVSGRTATAIVTGAVTGVNVLHMAVIEVPPRPWLRRQLWWIGTVAGLAVGFVLGRS